MPDARRVERKLFAVIVSAMMILAGVPR